MGTPIIMPRDETSLIGCFINTLVLQTDFSSNPSFRELLDQVRSDAKTFAHQVPFGAVSGNCSLSGF